MIARLSIVRRFGPNSGYAYLNSILTPMPLN
jgi:hypothetical protein